MITVDVASTESRCWCRPGSTLLATGALGHCPLKPFGNSVEPKNDQDAYLARGAFDHDVLRGFRTASLYQKPRLRAALAEEAVMTTFPDPHSPIRRPERVARADNLKPRHGHSWMMIACCIPMLAIAVALVAAGAVNGSFLIAAVVCAVMMALMMRGMGGSGHRM